MTNWQWHPACAALVKKIVAIRSKGLGFSHLCFPVGAGGQQLLSLALFSHQSEAVEHRRLAQATCQSRAALKGGPKRGERDEHHERLLEAEPKLPSCLFNTKIQNHSLRSKPFLLFHRLSLQAIHYLDGAVPFAPVDGLGGLGLFRAAGGHLGRQAEVGPDHAVVDGQLGGDALHTLTHRDLHSTHIGTARVPCGGTEIQKSIFQQSAMFGMAPEAFNVDTKNSWTPPL